MKTLLLIILIAAASSSQENYKGWVQQQNIPPEVSQAIREGRLDSIYSVSFHLNPFYLRGDFDGDEVPDYAVLVKRSIDGKTGVAIFHGSPRQVMVCGAGKRFGNGGDDFQWLDAWHVYPKAAAYQGATELSPPVLKGDAVLVQKLEAASALIYWSGKKYEWYQQGD